MPALGVRAQLCFVERRKGDVPANRHRFGGAQQPARARRHDLFLAGDQADFLWSLDRDNAVINLTREQAQRKADHARRMAAQSLNGEMRFAGIGRAEHRLYGRRVGAAHPV